MNRTVLIVVVVIIVAAIGGYFYMNQQGGGTGGDTSAGGAATGGGGATAEIPEALQPAVDFCKEKGGTIETQTIAEGVTHLCVMADGAKAEVSQYMKDNKTE